MPPTTARLRHQENKPIHKQISSLGHVEFFFSFFFIMVTKRRTNDTNTQHKHSVPEVTDKRIQMLSVSQFGRCIFQRMAELSVVKADPVNSLFPLYLIGSP